MLELKEKILTVENVKYVYKILEKRISKDFSRIPKLIKKKKAHQGKLLSKIHNYL